MSISNYNILQQTLINYSRRRDASTLMPTFIGLCENEIDKKLRQQINEKIKTATLSVDDRYIKLPEDLLEIRKLSILRSNGNHILSYRSPAAMKIIPHKTVPTDYTISSDRIELNAIPDASYNLEMVYYSKLAPLSETNITNNVLSRYPNIYLYGTLAQIYNWAQDDVQADKHFALFYKFLEDANSEEMKKRIGAVPYCRYEGRIP